jgi:hypothetical protein
MRIHESPALAIVLLVLTALVAWQSIKRPGSAGTAQQG